MRVLNLPGPELTRGPRPQSRAPGRTPDFAGEIRRAVSQLDQSLHAADQASEAAAQGKIDVHQAALSIEKADLQLRLTVKVRNKVLDAYQEMMRLSV